MSKARDAIRAKIFSSDTFKSTPVTAFGVKIEIRQAALGRVLDLQAKLESDRSSAISQALIEFCFVPGTDEQIFDDEDVQAILKLPFGEEFQKIQDVISKIMNIDIGEAEGNLEETSDDTTSTSSPKP